VQIFKKKDLIYLLLLLFLPFFFLPFFFFLRLAILSSLFVLIKTNQMIRSLFLALCIFCVMSNVNSVNKFLKIFLKIKI